MAKKIKLIAEVVYEPKIEDYPGCKTIEDMMEMDLDPEIGGGLNVLVDAIDEGTAKIRYEIIDA